MNNKALRLLSVFILMFGCLQAQQAVLTTGGDASGSGGTVNFSVGQIAYITVFGGQVSVSQGVQQPYEFSTLGVDNYAGISLSMIVFPNPIIDFVILKVELPLVNTLKYQLIDFSGKQLKQDKIVNEETEIIMKGLPSATYLLKISDETSVLKTFKIIKN
jgi:hypothetical protein